MEDKLIATKLKKIKGITIAVEVYQDYTIKIGVVEKGIVNYILNGIEQNASKSNHESKLFPSKKIPGMLTDGKGAFYPDDSPTLDTILKSQGERKGCGKETEWNYRKYLCGQFEDLKHSDHIILCPKCQEGSKNGKK